MADRNILHMLSPLKHVSPFDVNMAADAGYDVIVPYCNVLPGEVTGLVQDAIFSRPPDLAVRTGIFIGGRDAGGALDMLETAKAAMVPPFIVSLFADPYGSFTTAAAMVARMERTLKAHGRDMDGLRVTVFGATGVVGFAAGVISALQGARVTLAGHSGAARVEKSAADIERRFGAAVHAADASTEALKAGLLQTSDAVFCAGPAGVQLLTAEQLRRAEHLLVVADVNAVPPLGVEGVDVHDDGAPVAGGRTLGIGALAIGHTKYRTEFGLFRKMTESDRPVVYDFRDAFALARELAPRYRGVTGEPVLIAAQSGRALAASARRAGYLPLVADLFGDSDTRDAAHRHAVAGQWRTGFRRRGLLAALDALASGLAPAGLVCGSGFEDRPALLDAAAARHLLLGNSADTVRRTKDPVSFFALCRDNDVPYPQTAMTVGEGWLVKRIGGAGGAHIARGRPGQPLRRGRYAQRRVAGRPVSALFLGDGRHGAVLGFSEQWADPLPRRPYRYGGAVRPARLSGASASAMREAIGRLIAPLGLRGLNSADFLLREDGFDLIEINPRPGATLDVHPDDEGQLFRHHIAACRGRLPDLRPATPGAAAAAVVYAPRPIVLARDFAWPDWASDRQSPGSPVAAGAPFCTVRAEAADAAAARALLVARAAEILARAGAA